MSSLPPRVTILQIPRIFDRLLLLENVFLKVYTSFSRNRIFEYLKANDYIECRVQKNFIPKVSGTTEHTQQLAYIIRHAKKTQKTFVVTLLDLKNAFGSIKIKHGQ